MQVETYTDRYYLDVVKIVENFYKEAIGEYDEFFDPDAVIEAIKKLKEHNSENAFLLIVNGSCEGLLAGMEFQSMTSGKRIFQEIIWYVNESFRSRGVALLNKVQEILKSRGISIMIMAVLENSKTEKLKALYAKMGFKPVEVHYVKVLSNGLC